MTREEPLTVPVRLSPARWRYQTALDEETPPGVQPPAGVPCSAEAPIVLLLHAVRHPIPTHA